MPPTPSTLSTDALLEREYLPLRSRILDIASSLDRMDRSAGDLPDAPIFKIHQAIELLMEPGKADRAERIQQLFSREYDSAWHARWLASEQTIVIEAKAAEAKSNENQKESK